MSGEQLLCQAEMLLSEVRTACTDASAYIKSKNSAEAREALDRAENRIFVLRGCLVAARCLDADKRTVNMLRDNVAQACTEYALQERALNDRYRTGVMR